MDFSYYVDQELDRQQAEELNLTLDEYYDFLSDLRNKVVKDIEEWRKLNYETGNWWIYAKKIGEMCGINC